MSEIKDAADRGFLWLELQKPYDLKEISRFTLVYTLWDRENKWLDLLKESLQNFQGKNVRDIARTLFSASTTGISPTNIVTWVEEQQNEDGSWGEKDVYDTTYSLTALANTGRSNPTGCKWLINNFSPKWEHPGTVSLIITSLVKQGNTGTYDAFINQKVQWLLDNEEVEGGWKYIATTTIVIDALISAGHPEATYNAVKWILKNQNPDGSWGKEGKSKNTTAMVLACFAGVR